MVKNAYQYTNEYNPAKHIYRLYSHNSAMHSASIMLLLVAIAAIEIVIVPVQGDVFNLTVVKDTTLEIHSNLGSYGLLLVGNHPLYPIKRFVIQFEDIPAQCSSVYRATMVLKYSHSSTPSSTSSLPIERTLCAHRVLKSWSEDSGGVGLGYIPLGDGASSTCLSNVTLQPWPDFGSNVTFDITVAAKSWNRGNPNYGILVLATNENIVARDRRFFSSEAGTSYRPYLLVDCS